MITYWSQEDPWEKRQQQKLFVQLLCCQLAAFHSMHTQFHTHIHTQIRMPSAPQTCTVNGALSHQLVSYCYQTNCTVQISQAPRGVAKDFATAFLGNWAGSLVKSTERNIHVQTWKPELRQAREQCLVLCFLGLWQSVWECSCLVTGCITPNLSHWYQH